MTREMLEKILDKCREGNRAAQKELYDHFYAWVFAIIRRYVPEFEEAREVTNDVFFKVFTKINRYTRDTDFKAWLGQVARRVAIDRYRAHLADPPVSGLDEVREQVSPVAIDGLDKLDAEEKIWLIQKLSHAYRLIFNLYAIEQLTHEEIASLLGISIGTSKSNLFKARAQLKLLMAKYLEVP